MTLYLPFLTYVGERVCTESTHETRMNGSCGFSFSGMPELFYCPTCSRVYALDATQTYLCSHDHKEITFNDGRKHRLSLTERIDSDKSPWPVPNFVEEVELQGEGHLDNWVESCKYPEDEPKNDMTRHDSANRIGGHHLSREQVTSKFKQFVLARFSQ